jgi:hypothetical protein
MSTPIKSFEERNDALTKVRRGERRGEARRRGGNRRREKIRKLR